MDALLRESVRPPLRRAPSRTLDVAGLAEVLGVGAADLASECRALIEARDFDYVRLSGAARDAVLRGVLGALLDEALPVSGPARLPAWEAGWADILDRFAHSGGDVGALLPHYLRPELTRRSVMRLGGHYVLPADPCFEASFVTVVQAWVATTFLADAPAVYEFGCGPGHNLVAFARLWPEKRYVGLDWAAASQRLLGLVAARLGVDLVGLPFDMFAPDPGLPIEPGSAVVTVGAMEQLGEAFEPFLAFLLAARPRICVHLEPAHELYDRRTLFDDLAARYAERRGYLRGYLPRLRALARQGRIELLHVKRHLGSLYHDGWASMVWRSV